MRKTKPRREQSTYEDFKKLYAQTIRYPSRNEYKKGDSVILSVESSYFPSQQEEGGWLPGTITAIYGRSFEVQFPNGYENVYRVHDLRLVQPPPQNNREAIFLLEPNR